MIEIASMKYGEVSFFDSEEGTYIRLMVSRKGIKVIESSISTYKSYFKDSGRYWEDDHRYKKKLDEIVKEKGGRFLLCGGLLEVISEEEINEVLGVILW